MERKTSVEWKRVTVVGCGLVGASFALALRRSNQCSRIAGWDSSPAVLDAVLTRGIIDEIDDALPEGGVSESEFVYLAMPVGEIIRFLREQGTQLRSGAVITDAGSTKSEVCRAAQEHLPKKRSFVGGHPIAGSHLRGPAHAHADLFEAAPYVLVTNGSEEQREEFIAVSETIRALGARVVLMTAAEHDRALALTSHLPQLAASALAGVVREQLGDEGLTDVAGAGYRDMTRLAASHWSMWRDILATNDEPIAAALDEFIAQLSIVRDELRQRSPSDPQLAATETLFRKAQTA